MGTGWGWEEFEKESWAFKVIVPAVTLQELGADAEQHNRLALEKRIEAGGEVKTSDIAKVRLYRGHDLAGKSC